jgi:hypothetical protein
MTYNNKGRLNIAIKILLIQICILIFLIPGCSDLGDDLKNNDILGCMDLLACNFDGTATLDDGSCIYEFDVCNVCGGSGEEPDDCCEEGETIDNCGICGGDNSSCINFTDEILPIFLTNCTGCHGNLGGLNLSSFTDIMNGGTSGASVIPENGANSLIIQKLRGTAQGSQMPMGGNPLEESVISIIETWINEGAQNN